MKLIINGMQSSLIIVLRWEIFFLETVTNMIRRINAQIQSFHKTTHLFFPEKSQVSDRATSYLKWKKKKKKKKKNIYIYIFWLLYITEPNALGGSVLRITNSDDQARFPLSEVFTWWWYMVGILNFWFDFCFTALQHILGNFGRGQLP